MRLGPIATGGHYASRRHHTSDLCHHPNGMACRRLRLPAARAGRAADALAYYVAMPSLVFQTIADESLHALLDWRFLAAFGGGSMICFAAVMMFVRIACSD